MSTSQNQTAGYSVSVADRIRTMTNAELTTTMTDWLVGIISEILKDTEYDFTPDKRRYEAILAGQLAAPTTEKPRMYTLDEIKAMRGEKIYIVYINACANFYKNMQAPYYGDKGCYIENNVLGLTSVSLPVSYYGSTWVAFPYPPIDDDLLPIVEKLSKYDKTMYPRMTTCQLVNEQQRINTRLNNPEIAEDLRKILIECKSVIETELDNRRNNDPL